MNPQQDTQQNHNDTTTVDGFSLELLHMIPDDKEPTTISAQDELMQRHYRLNHLPFKRMFQMAKQGLLPKKIVKANIPICTACQYGKMHRNTTIFLHNFQLRLLWKGPNDCILIVIYQIYVFFITISLCSPIRRLTCPKDESFYLLYSAVLIQS